MHARLDWPLPALQVVKNGNLDRAKMSDSDLAKMEQLIHYIEVGVLTPDPMHAALTPCMHAQNNGVEDEGIEPVTEEELVVPPVGQKVQQLIATTT